jgi:hypothetical protein
LIVLGIDFSIQFPSACISKDLKSFKWISCVNSKLTKAHKKLLDDIEIEYPDIKFIHLPEKKLKSETYSGTERAKLLNYSLVVNTLLDEIIKEIAGETDIIVSIEGIAYGAQGNSLIDICQSTGMFRIKVLEQLLNNKGESFFVFSPGELKNSINAKGNAGKYDVFLAFKNDPQIAKGSALHRALIENESSLISDQKIKAPFTDMVDAYLAVLKIHRSLTEQ